MERKLLIACPVLRASLATMRELVQAAERFQQGDLAVRVVPRSAPEFRAVASAFNAMGDELGRLLQSLQDSEAKSRALFENAHDPMLLVQVEALDYLAWALSELVVLLVLETDLRELVDLEGVMDLQTLEARLPHLLVVYTEAVVAAQS